MTGSGMFLRNIWRFGSEAGDHLHLLCAGYADDDFGSSFGPDLTTVRCGGGPDAAYADLCRAAATAGPEILPALRALGTRYTQRPTRFPIRPRSARFPKHCSRLRKPGDSAPY